MIEMSEVERWVLTETTIQWVCGGGRSPAFAYTAGYWSQGLPELVVSALSDRQAMALLNVYGARQYERKTGWKPDDLDRELFTMPTKISAVADDWIAKNMSLAFRKHKPRGPVVQVLWPDRRGIFPDEPGYSIEFKDQKVFA